MGLGLRVLELVCREEGKAPALKDDGVDAGMVVDEGGGGDPAEAPVGERNRVGIWCDEMAEDSEIEIFSFEMMF